MIRDYEYRKKFDVPKDFDEVSELESLCNSINEQGVTAITVEGGWTHYNSVKGMAKEGNLTMWALFAKPWFRRTQVEFSAAISFEAPGKALADKVLAYLKQYQPAQIVKSD